MSVTPAQAGAQTSIAELVDRETRMGCNVRNLPLATNSLWFVWAPAFAGVT